jgi:hypothetical protein
MAKKTHKPPSRARYELSHPTVSARISKNEHQKLKQYLDDREISLAEFIRESLEIQKPKIEAIWEAGREQGYSQAKNEFEIWYFCHRCSEPITILPNSKSHKALIEYMFVKGWRHANCR